MGLLRGSRLRAVPFLALVALAWPLSAPKLAAQQSGGPVLAVHRQPAIPLVSIRLSLLVDDPPGLAGAGHLIQHLHYPALRDRAHDVGARVQIERTSDAIVYTVTGPTAELSYLTDLLRSALEAPVATPGGRLAAERDLTEERLAEWETAGNHLRAILRGRLFPGDISAAGTPASAARLSDERLSDLWEQLYRPDRLAVVAVGDVTIDQIRRAFADLPSYRSDTESVLGMDTTMVQPLAFAEATRAWFGTGHLASDLPPAAVSVTVRMLHDRLQRALTDSEVSAEHWWTHHGQAVVLVVAAPGNRSNTVRARLAGALDELRDEITEDQVTAAARAIRHDMLFFSRTPDRMAEVVGRFIDRGGDADAAQRFYADVLEVDVEDVLGVIEKLGEATAVEVEIPPQNLQVSR